VKRVLDAMGYEKDFWRVRMRPGSPVGFGWLPRGERRQPVFSLPGNPASAFVTFEVFVRPFLRRLAGHARVERRKIVCRAGAPLRMPAELTYFLRVGIEGSGADATVTLTGSQGSGLVSGLARTEGLTIIPDDVSELLEGDEVTVMLIREP
jgi:molybdopterin molybdotransferase